MYLLATPFLYPASLVASPTTVMRSVNFIFGLVNFSLFDKLYKLINGVQSSYHPIAFVPYLYFFNFLFYTDTISTCFVLASCILSYQNRNILAAFFVLLSLSFRQTNIIWVVFSGAILTYNNLKASRKLSLFPGIIFLTKRKTKSKTKKKSVSAFELLKSIINVPVIKEFFRAAISSCYAHICICGLFVGLVVWNGSVALGDKANHVLTVNIPQIFYFSLFAVLFSPFRFIPLKHNLKRMMSLKFIAFLSVLSAAIGYICFKYSNPHPFLLADNRHYSFYIWRRLLDRDFATKVALCPIYALSLTLITVKLLDCVSILETLALLTCTFAVLIVSPLFEFRYFIVPTVLLYINCAPIGRFKTISAYFDWFVYSVINSIVIYVFLFQPFSWSHEPGVVQRFMW